MEHIVVRATALTTSEATAIAMPQRQVLRVTALNTSEATPAGAATPSSEGHDPYYLGYKMRGREAPGHLPAQTPLGAKTRLKK